MCEELVKFYEREAQADLDALEMMRHGWLRVENISWSQAARKWRQAFARPNSLTAMAERRVAVEVGVNSNA